MLGNPGSYANKKRKKPVLKHKKVNDGKEVVKSNPSKRHRDRLNGELDRLTDLLPFSEDVRSRLDKLSVLRLSVGYLRVKSYFKATMKTPNNSPMFPGVNGQNGNNMETGGFSEGDLLLQALNGFVIVVTSDGSVFYVSPTIKDYLGFHQSDVVHQSVFELIHTDDRGLFRQQLHFALNPPSASPGEDALQSCGSTIMYNPEQLPPENSSFLERSFVCRFRCLLDNSSGFLALKFHGRLKYLHGQRFLRDGNVNKPQLALFSLAMPVQPPTIVEIRAKMLLFQTKHKLDFTPMGVDSRGKIILGYSEVELCMKGSGYQFIHAADMMYCADQHLRMMKTGESGLTVFRLLSKSGNWVWVKSNAKLIYKGGRPEFIIAYQKALVNSEGEEYLRQRRLQLPFSCTTGEGVLYNTGPTVDIQQFQFNKMFESNMDEVKKDQSPHSLLDCFLRQDESVYMQTAEETPLPVDQVFMESQALVSIASDSWQESGTTAATGEPVVVKEEAKQSVMAVINNLEEIAQKGDFSAALQNLEVGDAELMEWENALKRLSQDENQHNNVRSELDSILTNDIFDYIDSVLFKEKAEDCLNMSPPSCLTAVNNNQQDPFTQANGLSEPQLFPTPSPECTYSPMNGLYAHQQDTMNGSIIAGQNLAEPAQLFNGAQKLTHHGPLITQADTNLPSLQQLQLQDIFIPSIELPEVTVPHASAPFQPCGQGTMGHIGRPHGIPAQTQPGQLLRRPQNNLPADTMAANGQLPQIAVQQPNKVAPGIMDILPPLVPCNDFVPASTPNISIPFRTTCLQGNPPFQTHNHQVQQWQQSQQQKLSHAGIMQNGHELMPACHSKTPESQTFPHAGLWPRSVNGLNLTQQGAVTCGQAATQSSCMFDQHFSSSPAGGNVLALSGSSGLRGADSCLDQSPPQGSCYFQWSRSESVVGTSAINQENVNISPLTVPPNMSSTEQALNLQHYLECHRQSQNKRVSTERDGIFATPAHDIAMYLTE
ncbi:aryl hydrocarbon receptor-like isoform X2 [Centropristis striata]|uniref:aryl hydrocarbon receptor-like isoform X2 n=1 Tax=Centropristis striata TaxID=184440 RepID=UPI0027E14554|nr:aryl hydrocarbon receptor-like isoform X2 [Centropristis striata]